VVGGFDPTALTVKKGWDILNIPSNQLRVANWIEALGGKTPKASDIAKLSKETGVKPSFILEYYKNLKAGIVKETIKKTVTTPLIKGLVTDKED
jgi:hypothetical protein